MPDCVDVPQRRIHKLQSHNQYIIFPFSGFYDILNPMRQELYKLKTILSIKPVQTFSNLCWQIIFSGWEKAEKLSLKEKKIVHLLFISLFIVTWNKFLNNVFGYILIVLNHAKAQNETSIIPCISHCNLRGIHFGHTLIYSWIIWLILATGLLFELNSCR